MCFKRSWWWVRKKKWFADRLLCKSVASETGTRLECHLARDIVWKSSSRSEALYVEFQYHLMLFDMPFQKSNTRNGMVFYLNCCVKCKIQSNFNDVDKHTWQWLKPWMKRVGGLDSGEDAIFNVLCMTCLVLLAIYQHHLLDPISTSACLCGNTSFGFCYLSALFHDSLYCRSLFLYPYHF